VDLMEEQASRDPRDQNARDRLAMCSRELAEVLVDRDPQQALTVFDLGIRRLREIRNNTRARRREAQALAESSYALRRLHRFSDARESIETAFAVLREIKDYPAEHVSPDSEVGVALRAQGDYESAVGDPRRAVEIYEQLLAAMLAANPDLSGDLEETNKLSTMYLDMAGVYRRANEPAKAAEIDGRRLALWRRWEERLPHNGFVERQLASGRE
jgi:tetratricopeptide (TPR) repeat protein